MSSYERQCRRLLAAFPPDFRAERGEDLITTLLDDAPGGERRVSLATAANLVVSGAQMRAARAGASRVLRGGLAGGVDLAAVGGLGLAAALATASAVYFAQHGVIFYLLDPRNRGSAVGGQYLATWITVAVVCWAALTAMLTGRARVAAVLSGLATGYTLVVAAIMIHAQQGTVNLATIVNVNGTVGSPRGLPGGSFSFRYQSFVATPGLLAIGVVATTATIVSALRHGRGPLGPAPRTWWWLAAAAVLAGLFALVGDGSAATGPFSNLSYAFPPQGGIMTALQYLWGGGVLIGLAWSRLDPRVGWAVTVLSLPFLIYQIGALTIGRFYYGELFQPWWQTDLPMIGATIAIVALTTSAADVSRRLRRI